ncbi:rod shape-determining protein, partial [bacterium]|nr:rod shape-determining protein [bacterium]
RVSRNDAEQLKRTHGSALLSLVDRTEQIEIRGVVAGSTEMISPQRLIEIIAPRIQEMLVLVKEEMSQIPSRTRNPAGIVLTGGVTLLPGVREVAERVFNLPVRLAVPERFQGFDEIVKQPTYSTAVGLLLYGMKMRMESTERQKNIIERIYDYIREFLEKYL